MSRKWLLFPFCLLVALVLVPFSSASLTLRVNESASKVSFGDQGTRVFLAVENSLGRGVDAVVKLRLIDPNGLQRGSTESPAKIKPGANAIAIPISVLIPGKKPNTQALLWYRLRYDVTPSGSSHFDPISGVISLSEITPEIFSLNVAAPQKGKEGTPYRLRVRAVHPLTSVPVSSVDIEAVMKFDGYDRDDIVLKRSARTGPDGFVTLDFQIPRAVEDDEGELTVIGRRGILTEEAESEIKLDRNLQLMVSTDKPLYQPGQTLHTRVLMFDSARHALADQKATLKISDPERATAFRVEMNSSRFGIASADWLIPENTRLGDYQIDVELDDDKYEDARGTAMVKISRYDLPNFSVEVKPDRPYYLAGQNADIEVRAGYLFGQPVKRGRVRVVRETERSWNYREQKWDTEEGDKYEGEVDGEGRFVAHIDLGTEHEELKAQDYSRFRDISYAAYFTDPTTNRTEQRHFDLRLTKDAIHVYIVERNFQQAQDFPLEFYVATSYADGTPAPCELTISRAVEGEDLRPALALRTIRTNQYGIAKVSGLAITRDPEDTGGEISLLFRARDNQGAQGSHAETFTLDKGPVIRVETDKSLYRDGEQIHASFSANAPDMMLVLEVMSEERVLQSQLLHLQNGKASLIIPYNPSFTGSVTIVAYSPQVGDDDDDVTAGSHTVLYPHDRDLKLRLALNQERYRPGEEATASFLTRTATGSAAESSLGVVIFDKAVEERARTDRDFSGSYGFYSAYCYLTGYNGTIGGITRNDLNQLDLTKPIPDGFEVVAEVLLNDYHVVPLLFTSDKYSSEADAFGDFINNQLKPLQDELEFEYASDSVYPTDEAALRRVSARAALNLEEVLDPWQTPYGVSFFPEGASDVLEIASAGADKQFGTLDDFVAVRINRPYFRSAGEAINRAVARYHARTGAFIRDAATLKSELRREAIDLEAWRDPWGQPYQLTFGVRQTKYSVVVRSSGPSKEFKSPGNDGYTVWTSWTDYSTDVQTKIDASLFAYFKATSRIPQDQAEFIVAIGSRVSPVELRDPWGRPYYVTFKQNAIYGNRVNIFSNARYGEKPIEKTELVPVTQQMTFINLRSAGEDTVEGTSDDFDVASFSRLIAEQSAAEPTPRPTTPVISMPGSTGAITGTVTDPNNSVVPGAIVTAKNKRTSGEFSATTDENGVYIIRNVPAGIYEVSFQSSGFQRTMFTDVPVRSSSLTRLDSMLNLAAVTATVAITGGATLDESVNSTVSSTVRTVGFSLGGNQQSLSTPRLREYFPETLVWQPALETDKRGQAQLKFKLADNITTWKMSVIGSTEDGRIGTVEKEITAFQPFFIDHDPPRVLTEGDEISLPVVVRNYLDHAQKVKLEIKPETWFSLSGPASKSVNVAAGDANRETFDFRAVASIQDGKQRIIADGGDANDAIEKLVTVHPDGEQRSVSVSDVITGEGTLTLEIPDHALANSSRAELKIYPNLLGHVVESVEAIMERPHGCGEQTISSTYPSLLVLRQLKDSGQDSTLRAKAQRYLHAGYDRLQNYRAESGGFTYWGRGEPDLALTAYALRFLSDARKLITVNDDVINDARTWLIKQQQADGSWTSDRYGDALQKKRRTALLTVYVARVLAATEPKKDPAAVKPDSKPLAPSESAAALKRAFAYLSLRVEEIDEPYLIASYALAAFDAGEPMRAEKAIAKLKTLAREENTTSYWSLETNTPFYGWGIAGRVETTALVIQALARQQAMNKAATPEVNGALPAGPNDQLISRGLLFLLREKDRYGVWYSTQTTINVLDAMLVLSAQDLSITRGTNPAPAAEILLNGRSVRSVRLPEQNQLAGPITIDLSQFLQTGTNRVEVRRSGGGSPASAQAVATYYLPWSDALADNANRPANASSSLRLVTRFDKTESSINDEISCHVEAERIGFSGYGMLLAEVGLPPGANVDRASIEQAMKESGWSISQYDILPDRVVFYLWPQAGGTKFDFKFRPRFSLKAQTAPSTVYDYYNPGARAVVAPTRFIVR